MFVGLFKRFGQLVELALYKLCYVMLCLFVFFLHVVTCSQRLFYCCVVSLVLAVNLDRPAVKTRNRARGMGWNRANTNLV